MENRIRYLAVLVQVVAVIEGEIAVVDANVVRVEGLRGDDLRVANDVLQFVGDETTTYIWIPSLFPMLRFHFGMSF